MKVIIKRINYLTRVDYKFIKQQLKEKKIKLKDIAAKLEISRGNLYEMLVGNQPCSIDLLSYLDLYGIKTYYEGEYFE